jgi:hypothetical protein
VFVRVRVCVCVCVRVRVCVRAFVCVWFCLGGGVSDRAQLYIALRLIVGELRDILVQILAKILDGHRPGLPSIAVTTLKELES